MHFKKERGMRLKKTLVCAAAIVGHVVFSLNAQTITGIVKSSASGGAISGGVIAGVRVSLPSLGRSTQTGSDGRFVFNLSTPVLPQTNSGRSDGAAMVGSTLYFSVRNSNKKVCIDVFNLSGIRCGSLVNKHLTAGSYNVKVADAHLTAGLYIVRISIGDETHSFTLPVADRNAFGAVRLNKINDARPAAPAKLLALAAAADSLIADKALYIRSATPISQYSGDYIIVLDSIIGSDIVGKVIVGYQGWFSCTGDGSPLNRFGHMNLEMWPDVREYTKTYPYNGTLGNGTPAAVFSAWDQSTVNLHFLWMQQNGIDCAAIQRFGSELTNASLKSWRDGTATRVMNASQTSGRKFYVMYDISGWNSFQSAIKTDWTNVIVGSLKLTASPAYAKQNGKPVVCVWGIGFPDRPGNVTSWTDVVTWFKNQGCYVIAGTPQGWTTDATNISCYNACNMIMPWPVGVRGTMANFQSTFTRDLTYGNAHQIDYQAGCYAGTAFFNSNGTGKNLIPRMHGDFIWSQLAAMRNAGVRSMYIAMFDEMNEATQIFKTAEDASMIPTGRYYLTLDADGVHVSSDFYLRLVNNGGRMVKGLAPYQAAHTTPFVQQ
jgi:hypothetical protein